MRARRVAAVIGLAAALGSAGAVPDAGGVARHHHRADAYRPVVAPYLSVLAPSTHRLLTRAIRSRHLHDVTAAFVTGEGCTPVWGGRGPVAKQAHARHVIHRAQRRGVGVILSFGGEARTELALSCTSVPRLVRAYRSAVRTLGVTSIDFDIEGAAFTDPSSIRRRFHAIRVLEKRDRKLTVSLTVPVLPSGLDATGVALLEAARRAGTRVDLVNLMTMSYGDPREMGSAAISAAKHARAQLREIWPHDGYRDLGITAMIGRNDTLSEVFTLPDAKRVAHFARRHHVGRLSFWSLNRDRQCVHAHRRAPNQCSGVNQQPLAFTGVLLHHR